MPDPVVKRAKQVLTKLEEARAETGGIGAGLGELPLFAAVAEEGEPDPVDALVSRLADVDLDAISPRDALELLYDLSKEAKLTKR